MLDKKYNYINNEIKICIKCYPKKLKTDSEGQS